MPPAAEEIEGEEVEGEEVEGEEVEGEEVEGEEVEGEEGEEEEEEEEEKEAAPVAVEGKQSSGSIDGAALSGAPAATSAEILSGEGSPAVLPATTTATTTNNSSSAARFRPVVDSAGQAAMRSRAASVGKQLETVQCAHLQSADKGIQATYALLNKDLAVVQEVIHHMHTAGGNLHAAVETAAEVSHAAAERLRATGKLIF